jgi:L-fuconolactonase
MRAIDAHQHFWKYNSVRDAWITNDMHAIQRDFLPEDLGPLLQAHGFDGCVVVQSDQCEAENEFQLRNAEMHDFIKGVVGWIDFEAANIDERLQYYSQHNKLKGFRHILQGETQRDYMLRAGFTKGIGLLKRYNFTYDLLILPDQLGYATQLVSRFPDQMFVVDHIAKPDIRNKKIDDWKKDIQALAKHDHVFCKISGMVTEANWSTWNAVDFRPYMDVVVEAFGVSRIMYGSDWPVCLVAGSYADVLNVVRSYFSIFSTDEQQKFFGRNAVRFYNLSE